METKFGKLGKCCSKDEGANMSLLRFTEKEVSPISKVIGLARNETPGDFDETNWKDPRGRITADELTCTKLGMKVIEFEDVLQSTGPEKPTKSR